MLVYEVNLDVDTQVRDAYVAWLDAHAREIVALPGFTGARLFDVSEPAPAPGRVALCVQYTLQDEASLARYLHDDAPRMRADGLARFGGRFVATRRVLRALDLRHEASV